MTVRELKDLLDKHDQDSMVFYESEREEYHLASIGAVRQEDIGEGILKTRWAVIIKPTR